MDGSVWRGTNIAREEVLIFSFTEDMVFPKDGGTREDGDVVMTYVVKGDTSWYEGRYTYLRMPTDNGTGTMSGTVGVNVHNAEGDTVSANMRYSNQRFFTRTDISGELSFYPTDPVTVQ